MRNLDPKFYREMVLEKRSAINVFIASMMSCVGKQEEGGDNRGHFVEACQNSIQAPIGSPWCLSLIQTMIGFTELNLGVKSPLKTTAGVMDLWNHSQQYALTEPKIGSVAIWKSMSNPSLGHCGVVIGLTSEGFVTVEGNTSDGSGLEREGQGVYVKVRSRNLRTFTEMGFIPAFP